MREDSNIIKTLLLIYIKKQAQVSQQMRGKLSQEQDPKPLSRSAG